MPAGVTTVTMAMVALISAAAALAELPIVAEHYGQVPFVTSAGQVEVYTRYDPSFDDYIRVAILTGDVGGVLEAVSYPTGHRLAADLINIERGGLNVGSRRVGLELVWVPAGATAQSSAAATTIAANISDFLIGPYSSTLTYLAAQVSGAAGKLMMSGKAAATAVFTTGAANGLTFGTLATPAEFCNSVMQAVMSAVDAYDNGTAVDTGRACGDGELSCRDSLRLGALQGSGAGLFGESMVGAAALWAASNGVAMATLADGTGAPAQLVVDSYPVGFSYLADNVTVLAALRQMQAAGANLLYVAGLSPLVLYPLCDALGFVPYAIISVDPGSVNVDGEEGAALGEYVVQIRGWDKLSPTRGEYSNLTTADFTARYNARFSCMQTATSAYCPRRAARRAPRSSSPR